MSMRALSDMYTYKMSFVFGFSQTFARLAVAF